MSPAPISWGEYARLMLVLCGILALAVAAIRFWLPKMSMWNKTVSGPIEICARLPLEPRKTLYIVKAANSYMLLASSEAGVQHLASLSEEECSAWRQKTGAAQPVKL
jgi:flagellar biogenesis protein FliO